MRCYWRPLARFPWGSGIQPEERERSVVGGDRGWLGIVMREKKDGE